MAGKTANMPPMTGPPIFERKTADPMAVPPRIPRNESSFSEYFIFIGVDEMPIFFRSARFVISMRK